MEASFWLERWREGRIGFHQDRVTPLLQKYWPTLPLRAGDTVLVPLCGKSLDMIWLAEQGYRVVGVELAERAVEQFFQENGLPAEKHQTAMGPRYTAGNIEILCGDIFNLERGALENCVGVYDRAALVALPPDMRQQYVDHVYGALSDDYHGLLLTLGYPQHELDGPPFSVEDEEVQRLYSAHSIAKLIDRRDILDKDAKFKQQGVSRLHTLVYQLQRQPG